jgi:hypothetical protein
MTFLRELFNILSIFALENSGLILLFVLLALLVNTVMLGWILRLGYRILKGRGEMGAWDSGKPDWRMPRLEPRNMTAEFQEKVKDIDGMIRRLSEHSIDSPLIGACFRTARALNLNREQTFAFLAYHAVRLYEQMLDAELERISNEPPKPIMVGKL